MDGRLHGVHYNWRCCHHYCCYGDRRADKVSFKSISKSELFSPALDKLNCRVHTKGGVWGLLNHCTSDGSFRKSMLFRFFFFLQTEVHVVRGVSLCVRGGYHLHVNQDEGIMKVAALHRSQVQITQASSAGAIM